MSLIISTSIIIIIQLSSILIISMFTVSNLRTRAAETADQIATILIEPLYNVDDGQTLRIVQALLSSGEISGLFLTSSATGVLVDEKPERVSPWLESQERDIYHQDLYLGTIRIYYSDEALIDITRGVFFILLLVVLAVIAANVLITQSMVEKRVQRVFQFIIQGIQEIASGKYDVVLPDSGYDDMDAFIGVINDMSYRIRLKNDELFQINQSLEDRVAERTEELESALREQQLLQERLVESGKLAVLGQLSAGIAHELNTPLGAIQSSSRLLNYFFHETLPELSTLTRLLDSAGYELLETLILQGVRSQCDLFGILPDRAVVRRVAEELENLGIKDPVDLAERMVEAGLVRDLSKILPRLGTGKDTDILRIACDAVMAQRMLEVIEESSRKAAQVISALRSYLSPQAEKEDEPVDLSDNIRHVLTLMHNLLKHGIEVRTELSPVYVLGSADKLSQVWINLIRNAVQAMEYQGTLDIRVLKENGYARVEIVDSGPGIPGDLLDKVFDPFFTTKEAGDGLGLGLDISKKIIESHRGSLEIRSRPGRTECIVRLPTGKIP